MLPRIIRGVAFSVASLWFAVVSYRQDVITIAAERTGDRSIQILPLARFLPHGRLYSLYSDHEHEYRPGCYIGDPAEIGEYVPFQGLPSAVGRSTQLRFGTHVFTPHNQLPVFSAQLCLEALPKFSVIAFATDVSIASLKRARRDFLSEALITNGGQLIAETTRLLELAEVLPKSSVEWIMPLQPGLKIDRGVKPSDAMIIEIAADKGGGSEFRNTFEKIGIVLEQMNPPPVPGRDLSVKRFLIRLKDKDDATLATLAGQSEVLRIEREPEITLRSATPEKVGMIRIASSGHLASRLLGKGQIIGIIDDGLDVRHCFFASYRGQPADQQKIAYLGAEPIPRSGEADLHGTAVVGIAAGQDANDPDGKYSGIAPLAKVAFMPVGSIIYDPLRLAEALNDEDAAQARVISNSWGDDTCRNQPELRNSIQCPYGVMEQDIDTFLWRKEDDLVLVAVRNDGLVAEPENAKNSLAIAALNSNPSTSSGGVEIGRGAVGPTDDKRMKPELLAPGCRVKTAEARTACDLAMAPQEDGSECATSWATPMVAGEAARIREYFVDGWFPSGREHGGSGCNPTGALVKAMLLNHATNVIEAAGHDEYPSNEEGWGKLSLEDFFKAESGERNIVLERRHATGLRQGDAESIRVRARSLKATLVWMDAPAELGTAGDLVNDLDLSVREGHNYYCGNNFYNKETVSQPNPCANVDFKNNVERVVIGRRADPKMREFKITVHAESIWSRSGGGRQPYALVVSGERLEMLSARRAVTAKNCSSAHAE